LELRSQTIKKTAGVPLECCLFCVSNETRNKTKQLLWFPPMFV